MSMPRLLWARCCAMLVLAGLWLPLAATAATAATANATATAPATTAAAAPTALLPIPALTAQVIDQTQTLNADERQALTHKLAQFEQQSGSQIVILMVPSTAPEDIAAYAFRVADSWKIGRADVGDGLLIVVAKDDRTVRIEVARRLEGAIPDLLANRVIEQALLPAFRQGQYGPGLDLALDQLFGLIRGEELPAPSSDSATPARQTGDSAPRLPWELLLIGAIAISTLLRQLIGRGLGAGAAALSTGAIVYMTSASLVISLGAAIVLFLTTFLGINGAIFQALASGSGKGGSGGGRSGGGGFRSGGGGSFGGGGASGRW